MIDVRELHIGSHVRIGGKMHRVCAIDGLNEQIGIEAYKTETDGVKHPFGYKIGDITPIPLTAELLTEIGFKLTGDWGEYKVYTKQNITVRIVGERIYAKVAPNLGTLIDVKYLHELENFVYMALHKELIEE